VAALPIDAASAIVRAPTFASPRAGSRVSSTPVLCAIEPFLAAVKAARVTTLAQARQCPQ
jgi:hypothetical protein